MMGSSAPLYICWTTLPRTACHHRRQLLGLLRAGRLNMAQPGELPVQDHSTELQLVRDRDEVPVTLRRHLLPGSQA
eukprot:CAMPEP_0194702406 /NCGR_PEP_ID=MMETSP0295-20121207/26870_1 /TAXON_ID=39354 /ORGANISM="Heterosigma akashiwo, Strain CCMP2393" /LENGTH=75 /DNA_ID=CAMNT_0039596997 /DNA_START=509 /DNA_END=736 /DNA_ORIENTATION=+